MSTALIRPFTNFDVFTLACTDLQMGQVAHHALMLCIVLQRQTTCKPLKPSAHHLEKPTLAMSVAETWRTTSQNNHEIYPWALYKYEMANQRSLQSGMPKNDDSMDSA
eukprot:c19066_g1_i1 orf=269-592(+)